MNRLSLRNNRLKFRIVGILPIILEECIYRIYPNFVKENRRMSTSNRLDLQNTRISTDGYAQKSPRTVLGIIIGWDPTVCKSNRLHVDILRSSLMKLGYILYIPLKWWVIFFLQSWWILTGYFPNSTGSCVTNRRFSRIIAMNPYTSRSSTGHDRQNKRTLW
jgi:hypothetical protein